MDKVLSAIKSLQCASSLQVTVEEDTKVIHSGHTSSCSCSVKNEENETDAENPIQDNRSQIDEENREAPVNTRTFSERKRKSSAASNESTRPKTQKKVKIDWRDNLSTQSNTLFDKRCNQLLQFKEKFGHCNVSRHDADDKSLGNWCHALRTAYNRIQKGMIPHCNHLSQQGSIERLEEIGFHWKINITFEERHRELVAFKEEYGHCNIPVEYSGNPSLGRWCSRLRSRYKNIQKGMKVNSNLTKDKI